MTTLEFSHEFDILYNNIMSNKAPGLNEFEKSSFLTQAQESIVRDLYNGNYSSLSFENNEEITEYLRTLVTQEDISALQPSEAPITSRYLTYICNLPEKVWFITYESALLEDDKLTCKNNYEASVIPVKQDEVYRILRNPFKGPEYNKVLRLTIGDRVELISKYKIKNYKVRYIKKLSPIILEDLSQYDLSIDGVSSKTECELPSFLHRTILIKAVQLAKIVWETTNNN